MPAREGSGLETAISVVAWLALEMFFLHAKIQTDIVQLAKLLPRHEPH